MRVQHLQQLFAALIISVSTIVDAKYSICPNKPNELVPDGCASYSTIEELNEKLYPLVNDITQETDYFGYYRLDLFGRTCPFWSDDEGMCGNVACAVTTIDEKDIPPIWRAEELGKLAGPKASHPATRQPEEPSPLAGALGKETEESCVVEEDECDERDYCLPEDESAGGKGDYVSLTENPEKFTGYAGAGAANVWKAIYRENCFSKPRGESSLGSTGGSAGVGGNGFQGFAAPGSQAAMGFVNVMQYKGKLDLSDLEVDDECLEKRVFHRVISGMHASISMHLCWDYLNQSTGEWSPNLSCFVSRFENYPERLQNIYFNYALLARAVGKLRNYLPTYTFCSGDYYQNRITKSKVVKLANTAASTAPQIFDESLMFRDEMVGLKEEFRNRFRNVSRLMDCVGCDKCRLWGKVQTQGYGTALKILFEFDESKNANDNPVLRRTEMVALFNTFSRVSHSLRALEGFNRMLNEKDEADSSGRPTWPSGHGDTKSTKGELEKKEKKAEESKNIPDVLEEEKQDELPKGQTLGEEFWQEFDLVWKTFLFVIKSWYNVPRYIFIIAYSEVAQRFDMLMGRPVRAGLYTWADLNQPRAEL
ncbi:endoplasmic reticulum Oxidoreductin 1-domain-containing protein [Tuber borchii]|uniref:Endoplasmic reticulum Oxidoreductin 1-domain-containing protein n=1 Tax=Tuber borchii TaxID=42251 RepID=A0A2T7A3C6_TUBBO|nr:endoplasmic reticulum Oxidoreductin 1-domain-containing protein [Tuber borchii]